MLCVCICVHLFVCNTLLLSCPETADGNNLVAKFATSIMHHFTCEINVLVLASYKSNKHKLMI